MTLLPLRAIFRRAVSRGELAVNPCTGLQLPAIRGRRERFASVEEADALLAALPTEDRTIWATALLAGLRRGELMALRVDDIDLASGVIRVERGWDVRDGEQETKGRDRRRVPIVPELRDYLAEHLMRTGLEGPQLVFGRTPADPFVPGELSKRADRAWRIAELDRITLHECRHSFAALMIAAGVNAYWLSRYMGHRDVSFTLRRYGHLMPGAEQEAAGLLDSYLLSQRKRADERARGAGAQS